MTRIDDCLSARNGHLFVEEVDAVDLVSRFGSPLFVVSEDQVRRNVRRFQAALSAGWTAGPVQILPAVKASWSLPVLRILAQEGCGADVYSEGELELSLRAGIPAERISVNGVPKAPAHVRRTLEAGARLTIDSLRDVDLLEQIAPTLAAPARVRVRVRTAVDGFVKPTGFVPEGPVPTDVAALSYKSGLSMPEAIEAARRVVATPNVELVGFHQHHGRHHASTDWWRAQMKAFARDVAVLCGTLGGYRPKELDIGGGFAIPRDPHNAATDYLAPYEFAVLYGVSWLLKVLVPSRRYDLLTPFLSLAKSAPNHRPAPSLEAYAEAVTTTLLAALREHGIDPEGVTLQTEPGRSIHGDTGVHLATVSAIKRQTTPIPWNIVSVDTSEFFLTGGRFEHHLHDYRVASRMDAPPTMTADVTGRSCYADRILGAVPMPHVEVGDVVAFLDTGAYQEVSCSNFNAMPRPASVLVTGDRAEVIRRPETLDDVFARDVVPEHLQARRATEAAS